MFTTMNVEGKREWGQALYTPTTHSGATPTLRYTLVGPARARRTQSEGGPWGSPGRNSLTANAPHILDELFFRFIFGFTFWKWLKDLHVPRILCPGVLQQNLSNTNNRWRSSIVFDSKDKFWLLIFRIRNSWNELPYKLQQRIREKQVD